MERERQNMLRTIRAHGVRDPRVLEAMARVPRHQFIPRGYRSGAECYGDHPCPIGCGQTISQPYIVAYMIEKLDVRPGNKVLDVGTGSGYQAAVLAEMGAEVYTIEVVPELAEHAAAAFRSRGMTSIHARHGDGYRGWPEAAPFDAILAACAPADIPPALTDQLREGGRMVLPVGRGIQRIVILRKTPEGIRAVEDLPVRFVPMVPKDDE
jgi:protein-L-isoaspartate(D-aspartate) O-methyltransferase